MIDLCPDSQLSNTYAYRSNSNNRTSPHLMNENKPIEIIKDYFHQTSGLKQNKSGGYLYQDSGSQKKRKRHWDNYQHPCRSDLAVKFVSSYLATGSPIQLGGYSAQRKETANRVQIENSTFIGCIGHVRINGKVSIFLLSILNYQTGLNIIGHHLILYQEMFNPSFSVPT